MSIQNRLEKLEAMANVNSENCVCPGEWQTRVIEPDLDRTEEEYQLLLAEAQRAETCERCRKLIDKQIIIIQGVRSNILNPNFATFDINTESRVASRYVEGQKRDTVR